MVLDAASFADQISNQLELIFSDYRLEFDKAPVIAIILDFKMDADKFFTSIYEKLDSKANRKMALGYMTKKFDKGRLDHA